MKKMFLLFSHKLTEEQKIDAIEGLGIEEIVGLPEDIQKLWSQVSPIDYEMDKLEKVWEYVEQNGTKGDYLLIQGEWGWVHHSVNHFLSNSMIPVYSTTERKIEEIYKENGEVEKKSFFKHIKYKKY